MRILAHCGESKPLKYGMGFLLGFAIVAWLVYTADSSEVRNALRNVSCGPVAVMLLIIYLSIPLRVIQWRSLLDGQPAPSFSHVLRAICLGYLGSFLFPMGGGEFLKAFALSRSTGLPLARVIASVVVVRLQDLVPIALLIAVALGTLPYVRETVLSASAFQMYATLFCGALAVALIAAGYVYRTEFRKCIAPVFNRYAPGMARQLDRVIGQFVDGFSIHRNLTGVLKAQACAFACWILFTAAPLPLLMAFSLDLPHACASALAITGLATFTQLLPLTPGALGTYHVICLIALQAVNPGITKETAIAYALVSHLVGNLGPALPGVLALPWGLDRVLSFRRKASEDTIDIRFAPEQRTHGSAESERP